MLPLITAALLFIGVLNILMGGLVLYRDPRHIGNRLFFLYSLAVGGWVIGIAGFLLASSPGAAYFWAKAYYAFPLLVAATMPLFAYTFPVQKRIPKWLWYSAGTGLALICVPLLSVRTFVTESLVYHEWGKQIVLDKPQYLIYSAYLLVFFAIGLVHMHNKAKRLKGREYAQLQAFYWGFIVASSLGIFFNLILPWFGNYKLIWLGPLSTNALIIATGYSIVKHKMFDIRFYVVRGAAYSLTLLALSLLYVGPVVYGLIVGLGYELRWEKFAVAVIVGSIAAFYYQNLRQRFDRFTAKIFFRDDYDSELFISQLNKAVVSNLDLNSMLVSAADIIKQNMKTEYCLFMIKHSATAEVRVLGGQEKDMHFRDIQTVGRQVSIMEEKIIVTDYIEDNQSKMKEALRNNNVAVVGRLSGRGIDEDLVQSYILLGPRKSGNLYNMRDIRILEAIIDGLTVAIQNALRFEEIQDFNTNLQRRIDEATRQLRRTNAKLQALDETKDDFISMASHQLRTPLTTIKGYISMVLDGDAGPLTPTQQKMLDQAFVSSQRMVFLIADLLNISRLKTGKFVIEPSKVDLAKVVDDEIRQLKETAAGRNLELVYDKPADFPDLMLDETKIRQVIMNFIDNAIYYTPSGGKITVKLIDSPGTVEFRVIDSGIGVPKSEQPHLFTKFYRAGNARRARPDGTGLGLFMAKKVIVAQGGLTIFESKEGKGSTFGFIFSKAKVGVQPEPKKIPVTA